MTIETLGNVDKVLKDIAELGKTNPETAVIFQTELHQTVLKKVARAETPEDLRHAQLLARRALESLDIRFRW